MYQNTKQRGGFGTVTKENPQKALATAGLLIAKIRSGFELSVSA
ncbi:hypothetical protein LEP1GSC005_2657 [Leptospira santarosai str. ST188]|nr:hypothetical protein LEP1GSC005_2657 [Leptospira santarosai str. ST188]